VLGNLTPTFMAVATGKTGKSAHEAVALGYASADDTILFNPRELLWSPSRRPACWRMPAMCRRCRRGVPVAGRAGIASMEMTW
jgi:hypothetical protein